MKKGDLVRVRADHPCYGGMICTFLRVEHAYVRRIACLAPKKRRVEDIWVDMTDIEPASVIDKLGKLLED